MAYSLWVRRYAPFESFGFGFEGDARTEASASMSETARISAGCSFGPDGVGSGIGESSGTDHFLWPFEKAVAKIATSVTVQTRTTSTLRFIMHSEGGNPLVPLSPDIDTFVHVSVSFSATHLQLDGEVRGDDFPNAEVFVYDAVGGSVLLFGYQTTGGRNTGPAGLFGANADQSLGTFSRRIPLTHDGHFRILVRAGPDRTPIRAGPRRVPVRSGPQRRVPVRAGAE